MVKSVIRIEGEDGRGNFSTIKRWFSCTYDLPSIKLEHIPSCEIVVPNEGGINKHLSVGRKIRVYRNNDLEFDGVIQPRTITKETTKITRLKITAKHVAYQKLERFYCNSYDYAESGATIFGVTINPWRYKVFRNLEGTITSVGEFPAVDGVRPSEIFECLIGTRFIYQEFLEDASGFLETTTVGNGKKLNIYRDAITSQVRPYLQLTKNGTNYNTTGNVESIPLYNSDPNISSMGNISTVEIILWGKRDASNNDPTIQVCRNARGVRTYTSATLDSFTANAVESQDKWVYKVDLSNDGASTKNELGYKITISGPGTTAAPTRIAYILINAVTVSDLGFNIGRVETYSDTSGTESGGNTLRNGVNFFEGDFLGKRRLTALEELRKSTVSADTNPNPHWDIWFTPYLDACFEERRGIDKSRTYKFARGDSSIQSLDHEYDGSQIFYQVVAYGAGSGEASTRIVSKAEYKDGGLYDSTLDPDVGEKWGSAATIGEFRDSNIKSAVQLLRRARAFFKVHRNPRETFRIKLRPEELTYFYPGDSIRVVDDDTETDVSLRVESLKRTFNSDKEEEITIEVGEPFETFADAIGGIVRDIDTIALIPQPTPSLNTPIGSGTYCSKDIPGVWTFNIVDGKTVDRVFLSALTVPWHITSKGGAAVSTHSHTIPSLSVNSSATASGETAEYQHTGFIHFKVGHTIDSASTPVDFRLAAPNAADGTFNGVVITIACYNRTGSSQTYKWRVKNITQSTTLHDASGGVSINNGSLLQQNFVFTSAQVSSGDTISVEFYEGTLGTGSAENFIGFGGFEIQARGTHTHNISGQTTISNTSSADGSHTHPISFGIWQFDGDSGSGSETPIYGTGIEIWVDPPENANGVPTLSDTNSRLPMIFGDSTKPIQVDNIDITGYLKTETPGQFKEGLHKIYIRTNGAGAGGNNAQGLAVVQFSTSITRKGNGTKN